VSLNGSNTPVTAQLTVDTSGANHAAKVEYPRSNHGSPFGPASLWFVQAGLAGLVVAGSANGRRKRSRQVWMGMALLILLVVTTLVATGCAGYSQGGNGNTSPSGAATPAGNYTSTVTASASGGTGMQHSVDIKITVVE
jgi:hypothetical protein